MRNRAGKASDASLLDKSPLFDSEDYCRHIDNLSESDAVAHYLYVGWREGRDPSPYFSTQWYLDTYPDVRAEGTCPLVHFLRHGAGEGRSTSPFFPAERMAKAMGRELDAGHPLLAYLHDWKRRPWPEITLFDIDFFLHHLPETKRADDREPFGRYMKAGTTLDADPNPLFSTRFYLERNPDVLAAGINPLKHFVTIGGLELRDPHPMFDSRFYLSQASNFSREDIGIPLLHYLRVGAARGLDPNEQFSTTDYCADNPDIRGAEINPYVHYLVHGRWERRYARPSRRRMLTRDDAIARGPISADPSEHSAEPWIPLSVVIPTYNRVETLKATLEACERHRGGVPLEYVIVDDGSSDGTYDYIRDLSFPDSKVVSLRTKNSGPGSARNKAAQLASRDVLLFMGDDIRPLNDDFFRAHSDFHRRRYQRDVAMLGKIVWPSADLLPNNFVMAHIQGRGGEQFGFADMMPYKYYDYRFFYTANVSVKRSVIDDWERDGFSDSFKLYGFEDTEFAYRLSKKNDGFSIFYDPMSIGSHYHQYSFDKFVERQLNVGRMASAFIEIHPEIRSTMNLERISDALKNSGAGRQSNVPDAPDVLAIFEGLRAWINLLERKGDLGLSGYHKELLSAFFEFSFNIGYINSADSVGDNVSEASNIALDAFVQRARRLISHEIAGNFLAA